MPPSPRFQIDPSRMFRPDRAALADVEANAADCRAGEEAWRLLAARGLIPADWLDHPDRRFVAVHDDGLRVSGNASKRPPALHAPTTVRAAIAIASDVDGVRAAEKDARTCVARLAIWQSPTPRTICWDTALRTGPSKLFVSGPNRLQIAGLAAAAAVKANDPNKWGAWEGELWSAAGSLLRDVEVPGLHLGVTHDLVGAEWWRLACDLGLSFLAPPEHVEDEDGIDTCEDEWWVPPTLIGRPIREVDDPYAPMIAIWNRGYALSAVDDHIVLATAEV